MSTSYEARYASSPEAVKKHDTTALRDEFLINDLMQKDKVKLTYAAAKWGDSDDLAGAAIFLASRASDFVNGHILYVDGGIFATIGKPSHET